MSNWSSIPAGTRSARVQARRGTQIVGSNGERMPATPAPAAPAATPVVIAPGSLQSGDVRSKSVRSEQLASEIVRGEHIVAGTITADLLTVTQLSAIAADLGTITAGTITGAVFETAAAAPRVVIDSTGITMTEPGGQTTFFADASNGQLTLGDPAGDKIRFDPALAVNQQLYLEGRLVGTGSILGPSFLTGTAGTARVEIDGGGFKAYNAADEMLMDIDPSVGNIAIFTPSTTAELAFWDSPAGSARVTLRGYDTGAFELVAGSFISIQTDYPNDPHANASLSGSGVQFWRVETATGTNQALGLDTSGSWLQGSYTNNQMILLPASDLTTAWWAYGTDLEFGTGNALADPIRFQAGNIILSSGGTEKHIICALAGFTTTMGTRAQAAGAGHVFGQFVQYRQVRGNAAGTPVTPASVALVSVPFVNTNVASATIDTIRAEGCSLNISATAAGAMRYGRSAQGS